MPYIPAPTPPKITSLSMMLASGTIPPMGVKLSCIELTAPHDASVVTVAKSALLAMPKRTSLPSMFLRPGHASEGVSESCRDGEDREQRDQISKRRWVLKWMGTVGVEETAAV